MTPIAPKPAHPLRAAVLALMCAGFAPAAFAADPPVMTVTAEGTVHAAPDQATISMGVTTRAATAVEAMLANNAALQAVLDRLHSAGLQDADLRSTNLSLQPDFAPDATGNSVQRGYVASNDLSIRVTDLSKLGAILDAAVRDGANTLGGVTFGLSDPGPMLDQARTAAVQQARDRAALLADAAGVTLGPILSINEGSISQPGPIPFARMEAASVPVEKGEMDLTASVTIVWQLAQ